MDSPRLRPTFDLDLDLEPDAAMRAIRRRMEDGARSRRCHSKGRCAEFFLDDDERHLWTPYLSVQADDAPGGGTRLHGRFAPYPEVWTFFVFAYGVAWFAVLFGGAFGYAQWASGERAWGLWGVWIGLPAVLLLHVGSAVGQRLGAPDMAELRRRLDRLVAGLGTSDSGSTRPGTP